MSCWCSHWRWVNVTNNHHIPADFQNNILFSIHFVLSLWVYMCLNFFQALKRENGFILFIFFLINHDANEINTWVFCIEILYLETLLVSVISLNIFLPQANWCVWYVSLLYNPHHLISVKAQLVNQYTMIACIVAWWD